MHLGELLDLAHLGNASGANEVNNYTFKLTIYKLVAVLSMNYQTTIFPQTF